VIWPLATPFLLAAGFIVIVVAAFLLVGALPYAFARLGISPGTASVALLACLIGSAVNIPIARLSSRAVRVEPYINVFGLRYFVPVMRKRVTVLAVNVGGGVVRARLSAADERSGLRPSTSFPRAGFVGNGSAALLRDPPAFLRARTGVRRPWPGYAGSRRARSRQSAQRTRRCPAPAGYRWCR
jgi:hypothetical protein